MNNQLSSVVSTNQINLYINITNIIYTPKGFYDSVTTKELSNLPQSSKYLVLEGFLRYLAITMRKMLKYSIRNQYYKSRWKPLNKKYLEFKKSKGLSENIWEATGLLYKSISYRRVGNRYVIGINPKITYKDGTPVYLVARYMEYGTKYMPARPLFKPVLRYIKTNISTLWRLYITNPRDYLHQDLVNKLKRDSMRG